MYTGVFYARYILGKWTKAEGLVYPFFNAEKHMIDDDGARGRYYISCDYGTLNPCVFGLWRVNGNSAFMVKEYDPRRAEASRRPMKSIMPILRPLQMAT